MRVIFDIGHGEDAKGKGVGTFKEHDFNCAAALKAKELAEKQGFEVLLTQQPHAKDIWVGDRAEWVNQEHKKNPILCLVSFHANASGDLNASGWSLFHWHNSTKGKRLAQLWQKHAQILPLKQCGQGIWECQRGTWTNFVIVRDPVIPCLLVEHFFFTNPGELARCNTPEMIELFAEVTVRMLCEYAGIEFKEILQDQVAEYKKTIQDHVGFSDPKGVWKVIDTHPYAKDLYRQWANSYKGTPG